MTRTRALIIDDHLTARNALRRLLERAAIEVVGDASNFEEGLHQAHRLQPHIIILDSVLPQTDGLAALATLTNAIQETQVIYLGTDADSRYIDAALRAGASSYVLKEEADTQLIPAVQALAEIGPLVRGCRPRKPTIATNGESS